MAVTPGTRHTARGAIIGVGVVALALIADPGPARGAGHGCRLGRQSLDSAAVLASEREWIRASASRDAAALACVLAPEFIDTDWRGELRTRADLTRGVAHGRYIQDVGDLRVLVFGRAALVRGLNVVRDSTGREVVRLRFTDVYRYDGGTWLAVSAQETPVLSGKPST